MPRAESAQRRHYAKDTSQPYGPRDNYVQPAYRAADQSPRQLDFAPGIPSLGTIPANPSSDNPEGTYALEPDQNGSYQGFPSVDEFEEILDNYLNGLSQRKQEKALITQDMYDCIHAVLMDPTNTTYGTPQFRFWVRKMFILACFQNEYTVTHEDKPVAAKEQIYQILVHCHGECYHGGRDKTCAQIKSYYSWIPKELVAQFVKACPTCVLKRSNNPKKFVAMLKDISGRHQGTEEQYIESITSPLRNRGGPSPRGSAGSSRSGSAATPTASASKPDPRLFAHLDPPLLSYDAPLQQPPSLNPLTGFNMSNAAAPPLFTPGALEEFEAKPMFRDASGSTTTTTTSSLTSVLSDSGYNVPTGFVSAVDQNHHQAQGWASGGSAGGATFHHHHLGVPGAVEMNRGLARSAGGDFGHPHASATAAAWAMHGLVAPHGYYLPASAGMAPSTSAPPTFHLSSSSATAFHHPSSFNNPFHVAADPNAASLYAHSTTATAQAQDQQEGLPRIKLEAAPSPALDTIGLPDPESPSPRPLGSSVGVGAGMVRRLGAPTSIDLSGSNFSDYRGSTPALLSAVSVTGFDSSHHHHHHGMTAAGSVPSSATAEAFFTVPPSAGAASFHHFDDHLQAGLLHHHHRHIPSAPPTSATAETFGALDLSRRPSMDDEFSGLDVLSYAAMGPPTFIDASAIHHHHHQAGEEEGVHGGEVSTQPHTRSPSPFSEAAFNSTAAAAAAATVLAPSVSRTSSTTLSEDDGPESEDAAGELEIEGLGDLIGATAKEVAEAVEQEFDDDDVFA